MVCKGCSWPICPPHALTLFILPALTRITLLQSNAVFIFSTALIAAVWATFGIYFKVLNRVPRHRLIVERILGKQNGHLVLLIGLGEIVMSIWTLTRWERPICAAVQTLLIVSMNTLEILLAKDLLLSAPGMIALNSLLLGIVWNWALTPI